jgi:hypothetical protein
MAMKEFVAIVKVRRVNPGRIHVFFASGEIRSLDLKRYARGGTVFEPLADPAYAAKCRIVEGGGALRWPGGMDMSAGAILRMGKRLELAQPPPDLTSIEPRRDALSSNAKHAHPHDRRKDSPAARNTGKSAIIRPPTSAPNSGVAAIAAKSAARSTARSRIHTSEKPGASTSGSKRK